MPSSRLIKEACKFLLSSIQNEHPWMKREVAPRAVQFLM